MPKNFSPPNLMKFIIWSPNGFVTWNLSEIWDEIFFGIEGFGFGFGFFRILKKLRSTNMPLRIKKSHQNS